MPFADLRYQAKRRTKDELIQHLESFQLEPRFSVGVWYFSPGGGRFHDRYVPDTTIAERIEMCAAMAEFGVTGYEAHYPNEINPDNVDLYKKLTKEAGIKPADIVPNLFFEPEFEFGSLSNPIPRHRDKAIERLITTLKLAKEVDSEVCGVWPGMDGYTYPLGTVFYQMWDLFEDAVATAMDAVPGVRVAIEPKPYEPAANNIYRNTSDGLLACRDIESRLKNPENVKLIEEGHALVGLQPEVGHIRMGFEEVAYAFSRICRQGRLANTHWNSQPLGNYDQDLNVGVIAPEQLEAMMYTLKMHGYAGYFGIDINPERMPVDVALKVSMDAVCAANDRINDLDHEAILFSHRQPDQTRGWLEGYLVRVRAAHADRLPALERPL